MLFWDNGSEFTSPLGLSQSSEDRLLPAGESQPTKPIAESVNGTLRSECLDAHWFSTLE